MADTSVKVSFIGDAKNLSKTIDGVDKDMAGLGKSSASFGEKLSSGLQKAGPYIAAAGVGIAVLGTAVKAAMEDEAGQRRLGDTLIAVANATKEQVAGAEKWIDVTQRATGVADDELRPALAELTRQTKDVGEAQKLLSLAMDVAQGTGKPLAEVTDALSKAYNGNEKAIKALSPELTALIKDGASADEVMTALAATFGGQAAANAETAQGKMARLNIAFQEMKESVGTALLPALTQLGDWMLTTGIPKMQEIATQAKDWWAKQDELKRSIKEGLVQLQDFTTNGLIPMGKAAWEAYQRVAPLVDAMNRLEHLTSGIGVFGTGGKPISEIVAEKNPPGPGEIIVPIAGRAGGGPVMGGRPYIVGERGPELFVPGSSGSIRSNGGGTTIILELNGQAFVRAMVDESNAAGGLPIRIRAAS